MAKLRGRGMSSMNYPIGMNLGGDPSQALVHSNPSGKFTVALSSIDLGQGMKSVTRQICAETLGVPVEDVYVDTADSDTGPHCMGSFASRGTHRVGNAVIMALYGLVRGGPKLFGDMPAVWLKGLGGGGLQLGSYWIAIWAMTVAPIAIVAALRETSVLFGALIAVVILKEPLRAIRVAAALLIVAGLVMIRIH